MVGTQMNEYSAEQMKKWHNSYMETSSLSNSETVAELRAAGYSIGYTDEVLSLITNEIKCDLIEIAYKTKEYYNPVRLTLHRTDESRDEVEIRIKSSLSPQETIEVYDRLIRNYLGSKWCSIGYDLHILALPR